MTQNGLVDQEGTISVINQVTMEDFMALLKFNPNLLSPLTNVIQYRLLAEKDAEIARLTELTAVTES